MNDRDQVKLDYFRSQESSLEDSQGLFTNTDTLGTRALVAIFEQMAEQTEILRKIEQNTRTK